MSAAKQTHPRRIALKPFQAAVTLVRSACRNNSRLNEAYRDRDLIQLDQWLSQITPAAWETDKQRSTADVLFPRVGQARKTAIMLATVRLLTEYPQLSALLELEVDVFTWTPERDKASHILCR